MIIKSVFCALLVSCVLAEVASQCGKPIYVPNLPEEHYILHGHFMLGVLFPVHRRGIAPSCHVDVHDLGLLQRLEALVYAVNEVNADKYLLQGYTLGFVMFDDCYTDLIALAQSLHFARASPVSCSSFANSCASMPDNNPLEIYDIIGMVASESSITTMQAANLMSTFLIPQISYFATTPNLSDPKKYPLFQRTVPSDLTQARVIIELLAKFNWTFIYVMYSEGAYGEGLYRALERVIKAKSVDREICFAEPVIIRQDFTTRDYEATIWQMLYEKAANVTLIIAPEFEAYQIMAASKRMLVQGRITWIASDAWARSIHTLEDIADETYGMISINIHSASVPRFDDYFQSTQIIQETKNPWMEEFLQQLYNCTTGKNNSFVKCADDLQLAQHKSYAPEATTSLVFDAVKTYALAIDEQLKTRCSDVPKEDLVSCVKDKLSDILRSVVFVGEAEDIVSYDKNGDRATSYDIFNVQKANCSLGYKMAKIGEWNQYSKVLDIDTNSVQWALGRKPLSNCSRPCGVGEGMELQQKRCCWTCVPCAEDQYTRVTLGDVKRCYACPKNEWPDAETRTECLEIIPTYITWLDSIGISLITLATFGICLSLVIGFSYILNNKHQLVKACSRELSYIMLFGIILAFCMVFTLVVKPTNTVCFISETGIVVAFTVVYAPLCLKTIRIWRIFEAGRKMNRKPKCVSRMSQLSLVAAVVGSHAMLVIVWLLFSPPVEDEVVTGPGQIELVCCFPYGPFISSMCINVILIAICSVFAFKTRKLPDNFNESRFLSFVAFSTVILWLAFIPGYFLTVTVYKALFLALMLCANGFIFLGGLFIPKIFAIYFVDKCDLHLRIVGGRLSVMEQSQNSHIGHFLQEVAHANINGASTSKGPAGPKGAAPASKPVQNSKRGNLNTIKKPTKPSFIPAPKKAIKPLAPPTKKKNQIHAAKVKSSASQGQGQTQGKS